MINSTDNKLESINYLNIELGIKVCNGNLSLYKKMLMKFYQGYHDFPVKFTEALKGQNNELATRLAHSLNGVAGSMGASQVQDKAEMLESACRENANLDLIHDYLNEVKKVLEPLMDDLHCWDKD